MSRPPVRGEGKASDLDEDLRNSWQNYQRQSIFTDELRIYECNRQIPITHGGLPARQVTSITCRLFVRVVVGTHKMQ
jgi:hypothetical protein